MAGKKVASIRLQIILFDEDGEPMEKRGQRFEVLDPAKYPTEVVIEAFTGTARRTIETILKEGLV